MNLVYLVYLVWLENIVDAVTTVRPIWVAIIIILSIDHNCLQRVHIN